MNRWWVSVSCYREDTDRDGLEMEIPISWPEGSDHPLQSEGVREAISDFIRQAAEGLSVSA